MSTKSLHEISTLISSDTLFTLLHTFCEQIYELDATRVELVSVRSAVDVVELWQRQFEEVTQKFSGVDYDGEKKTVDEAREMINLLLVLLARVEEKSILKNMFDDYVRYNMPILGVAVHFFCAT